MKRRVFVAIPIPENIKEEIIVWQRQHPDFAVRWVKPENLHITVMPPWYISEISEVSAPNSEMTPPKDGLSHVENALNQAVSGFKPFSVHLLKILYGPPRPEVRLIWAEGPSVSEFNRLQKLIEDALLSDPETEFVKKESRPPKLHLTLARFEPTSIKKLPRLDEAVNWKLKVGEIQLMESVLKRTGAEYTILKHLTFNI